MSAQNQANNWCFGNNIGLNFSCDPPKQFKSAINSSEGCSGISDASGNLLFYTDGDSVWDKTHHLMPNGTSIGARCSGYSSQSSTQSSLIVPKPGDTLIYYIFTTDCLEDNYSNGLRYSIVDLSLNSGKGDVSSKNILLNPSTTEKVAGIFHSNKNDIWVICHEMYNNVFKAYLVTNAGITLNPVVSAVGQIHNSGRGYLKFSPNGSKLVSLAPGSNPEMFSFNDNTGTITSMYILPDASFTQYYGASFSPNNDYLYLSCVNWICGAKLHQFNVSSSNPAQVFASKYIIDEPLNDSLGGPLGALQLSIDGKIYFPGMGKMIGNDFISYVGVINDPNNPGPTVNYEPKKIKLYCNRYCGSGMPNYIESYFQSAIYTPTCLNTELNLNATIIACSTSVNFQLPDKYKDADIISTKWNFGDSLSGIFNNSLDSNPNHVFTSYANYNVTVIVNYCQGTDTFTKTISLLPCKNDVTISVPNVITANNDGVNDVFKIAGLESHPNSHLTIYNRWGNIIFATLDYRNNWRPDNNAGTYYYILVLENGEKYKGFFEIFTN